MNWENCNMEKNPEISVWKLVMENRYLKFETPLHPIWGIRGLFSKFKFPLLISTLNTLVLFSIFNILTSCCSAQFSDSTFRYKGMLSVAGTIAIGTMPQNNITNAYFTGYLEYYA